MYRKLIAAAMFATIMSLANVAAFAGASDYEFQLAQSEVKKGDGAIVAVRLVDKRSGATVPEALIVAKRIEMGGGGMATMTAPLAQLPSTEPGIYRFKADLSMEGDWQLLLAAKVQGEIGTIESKLMLKVLP